MLRNNKQIMIPKIAFDDVVSAADIAIKRIEQLELEVQQLRQALRAVMLQAALVDEGNSPVDAL
jgi:hypothetical protein